MASCVLVFGNDDISDARHWQYLQHRETAEGLPVDATFRGTL